MYLLADFGHGVDVIEPDRIQQQIRLEARRVALVAQAHGLEVAILDERALVGAAVPAKDMAAVPAVVLAHHHGEVCVAALAPEHCLVLDPARALFALLRLLELLQWPARRVRG